MAKLSIAFILCYISGILGLFFVDVAWGIYLYEWIYFLFPQNRWWYGNLPNISYSFYVSFLTVLIFLINKHKYKNNHFFDVPQTKWIIGLTILMSVSCFYAVWPQMHNRHYIDYIKLLIIVAVLYKVIDTPKKFEIAIWVFLTGVFYIAWEGHNIGRNTGGRLEGIGLIDGSAANDTAAIMITAIPLLIYKVIYGRLWQRAIALVYLAFTMDCIILLNSRGALVGIAISIVFMIWHTLFGKIGTLKKKLMVVVGIATACGLFVYLTDIIFYERFSTLTEIDEVGGEAQRINFWLKSLEVAFKHPFGLGISGFTYLSPQILPPEMLAKGVGMRAIHSTYFQALSEFGFIGLFVFLGYIFSSILLLKKIRIYSVKHDKSLVYYQGLALISSYVAFLGAALFIDRMHAFLMYWLPSLIAAFYNIHVLKSNTSKL